MFFGRKLSIRRCPPRSVQASLRIKSRRVSTAACPVALLLRIPRTPLFTSSLSFTAEKRQSKRVWASSTDKVTVVEDQKMFPVSVPQRLRETVHHHASFASAYGIWHSWHVHMSVLTQHTSQRLPRAYGRSLCWPLNVCQALIPSNSHLMTRIYHAFSDCQASSKTKWLVLVRKLHRDLLTGERLHPGTPSKRFGMASSQRGECHLQCKSPAAMRGPNFQPEFILQILCML